MKLFTKICISVAAVALGIGVLGVGLGLAMGAELEDLNEMGIYLSPYHQKRVTTVEKYIEEEWEERKITETPLENWPQKEGVSEEKESSNVHHTNHNIHNDFQKHHNDNLYYYECSDQEINTLKIDAEHAEIKIYAVDEEVDISYFSSHKTDISKVEGSVLKIKDENSSTTPTELEIVIPIGRLKEIEIDLDAGELTAERLIADYISIDMSAGSVQVDELVAAKEAEMQVDAGQLTIGYYEGPWLEVECEVGSVMVVCEGRQQDYKYELECGLGEIRINEESYAGIGNNFRLNNESSKIIKAECNIGEIVLEFPNNL